MGFLDPVESAKVPAFAHEHLIAKRIRNRTHSQFWQSIDPPPGVKYHEKPISLVGGMPNHGFFPVTKLDVHLASRPFAFDSGSIATVPGQTTNESELDLQTALQYANSEGQPQLLNVAKSFVKRVVKPALDDWDVSMTLGGADGIGKCFNTLLNPGDSVLFEEFTFNPILNGCREYGGTPVPIKLSKVLADGTLGRMDYADELEDMLSNWSKRYPKLGKPKALYTIPNGHNPLGVALSLDQKKRIYALAEKYDFFIIEDEPYAYLNFSPASEKANYELTNDEFIASLHPSYTTLDKSGRVARVETFSKIFAPGSRLGYVTAHPQFIRYIMTCNDILTRAPSGLSQAVVNNTIVRLGGLEGWIHWITLVRNEYLRRKNAMIKAFQETDAFKKGYISPIDPSCGMFISLKINLPEERKTETISLMEKYFVKCRVEGVISVLGGNMAVDKEYSKERANFVRIAICYPEDASVLVEAANRFGRAAVDLFEEL
ncbi:DEKNAAC103082 [Brettanomyces naardenensis]|uniref:DEKNAAC103082 n=1 Tax=Brettanomyces naardenensis TaxID=13370 RepID=A0A448YMA5_BRENA|nr:DEKNAAC103082 [Brettanomyces naardenensis]